MSLDTILVCLIYHFKIDFSTSIIKNFKGFRLFYFFAMVDGLPASRLASAFASSAGAVPKALCVRRFVLYRFACGDPVLIYNI